MFEKSSKFWAAKYKIASNPPARLDHSLYVHKPWSFLPNRALKMRERTTIALRITACEYM